MDQRAVHVIHGVMQISLVVRKPLQSGMASACSVAETNYSIGILRVTSAELYRAKNDDMDQPVQIASAQADPCH